MIDQMTSRGRYQPRLTDAEMGVIADTLNEPAAVVADYLGRTRRAIYHARNRLRAGWAPVKAGWTSEEDATLRATLDQPVAKVAEILGRTEAAVQARRSQSGLGRPGWHQQHLPYSTHGRTLLAQTCAKCGLLLDATWFGRRRAGSDAGRWFSWCTRCRRGGTGAASRAQGAASKRALQQKQALTLDQATRHGQPYTKADHEVLADPNLTILEKALRLGRTYLATCGQVSINGYASMVGLGDVAHGQWQIFWPVEKGA